MKIIFRKRITEQILEVCLEASRADREIECIRLTKKEAKRFKRELNDWFLIAIKGDTSYEESSDGYEFIGRYNGVEIHAEIGWRYC